MSLCLGFGTFYGDRNARSNKRNASSFFIIYFSRIKFCSTNLKNITLWDCKSWVDGRIAIRKPQIGWTNFIIKLLFFFNTIKLLIISHLTKFY